MNPPEQEQHLTMVPTQQHPLENRSRREERSESSD